MIQNTDHGLADTYQIKYPCAIVKVAFFGCGDSQCYGDYWCDAMGELHDCFTGAGASVIGKSWSYRQWSVLKVGLLNDKSCSNQAWFLSQTSRVNISVPRRSGETTSLDTLSARTTSRTRRRRGLCTVPVHFACIWIHHLWNIHNCETSFPGSHRGQPSLSPRAKSLTDATLTRRSPAYR